eukprot:121202-Chlamydomonas_euryale.AAC.2
MNPTHPNPLPLPPISAFSGVRPSRMNPTHPNPLPLPPFSAFSGVRPSRMNPTHPNPLPSVRVLRLQTKPHGHGDVHALLHSSGLAKKWKSAGCKWVCFFQVSTTQGLSRLQVGSLLPGEHNARPLEAASGSVSSRSAQRKAS